jgi:serine/threonine protein kinase
MDVSCELPGLWLHDCSTAQLPHAQARNDVGADDEGEIEVQRAVKTVAPKVKESGIKEFTTEAAIQLKLKHKHIVEVIGVCMKQRPFLCVLEYVMYGDLKKVLTTCREKEIMLRPAEQFYIAEQIADALEYITSNRIVHLDLAARNCLVHAKSCIKIADFGLARPYDQGEPREGQQEGFNLVGKMKIPFLWAPPECLPTNIWDKSVKVYNPVFNERSDVWAFGVVCWEIATYGLQPYGSSKELVKLLQKIEKGLRLEFPPGCPSALRELADACHTLDPAARPSFAVAKEQLLKLLDPMKHKIRDVGGLLNAPLEERLREMSTRATLVRRKSLTMIGLTPNGKAPGLATVGEDEEEELDDDGAAAAARVEGREGLSSPPSRGRVGRRSSQINLDDPTDLALAPHGSLFNADDWEVSPTRLGRPSLRRRSRSSLSELPSPTAAPPPLAEGLDHPRIAEEGPVGGDGNNSGCGGEDVGTVVAAPRTRVASTHSADLEEAVAAHGTITRKRSSEFYADSDSESEDSDRGKSPSSGDGSRAGAGPRAGRLGGGGGNHDQEAAAAPSPPPPGSAVSRRDSFAILTGLLVGASNDAPAPVALTITNVDERGGELLTESTPDSPKQETARKGGGGEGGGGEGATATAGIPLPATAAVATAEAAAATATTTTSGDGVAAAVDPSTGRRVLNSASASDDVVSTGPRTLSRNSIAALTSAASDQDLAFLMSDLDESPLAAMLTPVRPAGASRRASLWTQDQVSAFFASNDLDKWAQLFESASVDGPALLGMTPAELVAVGVDDMETRGLMMRLIRQVRAEDAGVVIELSPKPTVATPDRERERRTSVQRRRERRMNRLAGDLDWDINSIDEANA